MNNKIKFNGVCIDCASKNVVCIGVTEVMKHNVFLCDDCLTVCSINSDYEVVHTKKMKKIENMVVVS